LWVQGSVPDLLIAKTTLVKAQKNNGLTSIKKEILKRAIKRLLFFIALNRLKI